MKNVTIFEKTAVFPGGYGWIGEIPYGRIWPDTAGLGSIGLRIEHHGLGMKCNALCQEL